MRKSAAPFFNSMRTMLSAALVLTTAFCIVSSTNGNKANAPVRPQLVQDALQKKKPIYYFGLGSNMSRKKLENRGINGTKIEVLGFEAAVVPGFRLAFNMRGFPPLEPGMGSLEPVSSKSKPLLAYKEEECHGALVKLTSENYEKVMQSEGVGGSNTNQGYDEIVVDAYPYGRWRRPVKAVALQARPHVRLNADPPPSVRYMNILKEGAEELKLRQCYQDFLASHPVQKLSKPQKKIAVYNLMFTWWVSFSLLKWNGFSKLQSSLLFLVSAPNTAPSLIRLASDILTAVILLPGAILGFVFFYLTKAVGKTPPFFTRMMSTFGNEE